MKRKGFALAALAAAVLGAGTAFAADSPLLVRVGAANVAPKSDNTDIGVEVDNQFGPTFNIDWYFTPNIALDVLAALPFEHDLTADGDKIGSATHLPPTVSVQYHLLPSGRIDPYVGVGVNYTMFWDTKLDDGTALDLDNSFGLAGQVGVDFTVAPKWVVGADVRYVDIDTDANIGNGAVKTVVEIDPLVYGINVGYRF